MRKRSPVMLLALVPLMACSTSSDRAATTFALQPNKVEVEDAPAYRVAAERCLTPPGVRGGSVTTTEVTSYSATAQGEAVDSLRTCLTAVPGTYVMESEGRPGEETGLVKFLDQCLRGDSEDVGPADDFLGVAEGDLPASVRVLGKDRVCIGRTSDYRPDRLNVVIDAGKVVWAGRF